MDPGVDEITGWALAARDGDPVPSALFVRATQAEVWRMCAHLGDRRYADDLTQETFLRAFRSLPRFAGRSSARTWLLSIARRVCADHIREIRRRPRVVAPLLAEPGTGDGADGVVAGAGRDSGDVADGVVLRALVDSLDPDRREAFVLTQVIGLSYADAASVCGCPVGTIRSRVARARDDLVRGLGDTGTAADRATS